MTRLAADLADEIRIHQTVQITAATPFLVLGNVSALLVMASAVRMTIFSSYAIIPLCALFVLLVPMVLSYRKLRHRPRPERTSERRIRNVEIHSLLLGMCWMATLVLLFPVIDSHQHIWLVVATLFLALGSAPSVSSIPRAAAAFSLPMMFTSWFYSLWSGHYDPILIIIYHFGSIMAFAKLLLDNWRLFKANVVLSMEHTENLDERLRAEQVLRQNEAEAAANDRERQEEVTRAQRRLIDAIPFPLVLTTKTGVLPIGKQAARLFNIESEEMAEHILGDFFVDPSQREVMLEKLEADGQIDDFEVQLKGKDGKEIWTVISTRPLDYEGEACWLNSIVVIDERKQTEQELSNGRELLQALADNIPEFMSFKDLDGGFQFVNNRFEEWTGLQRADIIGKTVHDIYPAEQAVTFAALDRECLDSRTTIAREVLLDYPDGQARTVISTRFPVLTSAGGLLGLGTVNYDLTERKAMEEALRESERRLIEILDLSPIAVSIVDADNERLYGNSRLAEMLDLDRDAMVGGDRVRAFAPEDIARLYAQYEKDGVVNDFDIEGRRPEGSSFWATRSMAPIHFEGKPATVHWAYDITERKRAEREALEKTRILELTLKSMGQGLTMYDADWKLVSHNRQYAEHFGLPDDIFDGERTFDDVVGATMRQDYGEQWRERLEVVRDPSRMTDVWCREFTRPDGRSLDLLSNPIPTGGFVVTSTDISERKQAEQELAQKEIQLRVALDNMPGGMMLGDRDLTYVLVNPQYSELYEFPEGLVKAGGSFRDELRFQADRGDFGPGDQDELMEQAVATYRTSENVNYERTIAGSGRTLQVYVAPTPDGGSVTIATDITERKRTEEALAEKEAQLRIVLENMPGGIRYVDKDKKYVFFNARYSELYDFPDGLLKVGETNRVENLYQAERGDFGSGAPDKLTDEWLTALPVDTEPTSWERETVQGKTLQVNTAPTPGGGVVNIVTDITDRKRAEAAVQEARERAERLAQSRADLIATVSHEVRTPMNGVLGMAQHLWELDLDAESRECVDIIVDSGNSLLRIVDDLLDIAKLDADALDLERLPFRAGEVVADSIRLMQKRADEKHLELVGNVAADIPPVTVGDSLRLRQVLLNLISNAIKFTDTGSVTVDVAVRAADDGGAVLEFAVTDTGKGITPDAQEKLFSAYTQESVEMARKYGGTGLGLAICRRLVALMGGEITLESEPRKGSTFRFTADFGIGGEDDIANLPDEMRRDVVPSIAAFDTSHRLAVLQVEDNVTNREVTRRILSRAGHQVVDVADGLEALEAVAEQHFDIILMDRHMPNMNGLEATRRIRQMPPPLSAIPILGITASAIEAELSACLAAGMNEVLTKPVNRAVLLSTLSRLTGGAVKAPAGWAGKSVLVADDVEINRALAQKQLERLGFTCQFAEDGEEALAMAQNGAFDAVLLDSYMPRLDGLGVITKLRQAEQASGRHTPVIATTGETAPGARQRYLQAGMDDYLVKPVDIHELAAVLARLIPAETDDAVVDDTGRRNEIPDAVLDLTPMREAFGAIDEGALFMFERYRAAAADYIEQLLAALDEVDADAGIKIAHSAAGASKNAGARELGALLSAIEVDLTAGDLDRARERCIDLAAAWERLAAALDQLAVD